MIPKIKLEVMAAELNHESIGFIGFSHKNDIIHAVWVSKNGLLRWREIPPDNVNLPFNLKISKSEEV